MSKWYCDDPEYSQISKSDFELRNLIVAVLEDNNRDLSNSHWHGSNYGVPEDNFEDIAEDLMTKLNLWEDE